MQKTFFANGIWFSCVDDSDRIQDLEARLEAMTLQHAAALEAVGNAREEALREAAKKAYDKLCARQAYIDAQSVRDAILALINKGDSRE